MKNKFLLYFVGWLTVVALFNLIVFITPNQIDGVSKFDTLFWVAYGFVTLEFIIQLVSSAFVFKAKSSQRAFYSLPLYTVSYVSLVLMLVVGTVCMAVIAIPDWVGIIACSVVLAIHLLSIVSTSLLRGSLSATDQRIKQDTMFVKMMTVESQSLMAAHRAGDMAKCTNAVYEAFRYSDPMSSDSLKQIEDNIMSKFSTFSMCVNAGDAMGAENNAKELMAMINERNMKCKLYK